MRQKEFDRIWWMYHDKPYRTIVVIGSTSAHAQTYSIMRCQRGHDEDRRIRFILTNYDDFEITVLQYPSADSVVLLGVGSTHYRYLEYLAVRKRLTQAPSDQFSKFVDLPNGVLGTQEFHYNGLQWI